MGTDSIASFALRTSGEPRRKTLKPLDRSLSDSGHPHSGQRGFSLLELLVVMLILAVAALIGLPALQQAILRSKVNGFSREAAILIQQARQDAIKHGVPVVVEFDQSRQELFAFADVAPPGVDPDLTYTENTSATYRTVDWEVGRWQLPGGNSPSASIRFAAPSGLEVIDGFTEGGSGPPGGSGKVLVLMPNGSARDIGGFRFGDFRSPGDPGAGTCGNCFEIRIEPAATARVQVLKYHHVDERYYPKGRGENGPLWQWY